MSKKAKLASALALVDLYHGGAVAVRSGQVVEATEGAIVSLAKNGQVDPHPEAVAAATERGEKTVQLPVEEKAVPTPTEPSGGAGGGSDSVPGGQGT